MAKTILFYLLALLFVSGCHSPDPETAVQEKHEAVEKNDSIVLAQQQENELTQAYVQGIAAYIKAMKQKEGGDFDTLFLGKHSDFPVIKLPHTIEHTGILLLTDEEADKKLQYHKSFVFVNMIGTIAKSEWVFLMVTFFVNQEDGRPYYWPQHNCRIGFKYNTASKTFEQDSTQFEYPYPVNH